MACRIINRPIDGKEVSSKLWADINGKVNNESKADSLYKYVAGSAFRLQFGDWIGDPDSPNLKNKVDENGEPLFEVVDSMLPYDNPVQFNKTSRTNPIEMLRDAGAVWYNKNNGELEEKAMHPLQARKMVADLHKAQSDFRFKTVVFNNESAVVRLDNSEGQREVDKSPATNHHELVIPIVERLSKKLGVEYEVVSQDKAIALLKKQGFERTPATLEPAFYAGGKVYLVEGQFDLESGIHEFAHPFVDAIERENPELFNKLYKDFLTTPDGQSILDQVRDLGYQEDLIPKEVIVRGITGRAMFTLSHLKSKSIIDRILRYLRGLLKDLFGVSVRKLDANTNLQQLADLLISKEPISMSTAPVEGIQFNRKQGEPSDPILDEMMQGQQPLSSLPIAQREALEVLAGMRGKMTLASDEKSYEVLDFDTGDIVSLTRTSNFIEAMPGPQGQAGYYKFDGDKYEDLYEDNRQWGNQIDDILTAVLRGDNLEQAKQFYNDGKAERINAGSEASLSNEVVEQLYDVFTELKAEYPDSIILNQQPLYNIEKGVAGTADIMVVHRDGTVDILDLKTSVHPTDGSYEKIGADGNVYITGYTKKFPSNVAPRKASKKDKHQAQISVYTGLAKSQGILVQGDSKTIHIHLDVEDGSTLVTGITREPDHSQPSQRHIEEMVNEDAQYAGEAVRDIENSPEMADIMAKVTMNLREKKAELARKGKEGSAYALAKITEEINSATFGGAIMSLIHETEQTLAGDGKWEGWFKKAAKVAKDIEEDKVTPEKGLKTLMDAKEQIGIYLPAIKQMKEFYEKFYYLQLGKTIPQQVDPNSAIGKMRFLIDNMTTYQSLISDKLPTIQAKMLYPHIEPAIKKLKEESTAKREALEAYMAETEKRNLKEGSSTLKRRKKREALLRKEYENVFRRATMTEGEFAVMIREGNYDNIGLWTDIMINPAISSSNEIVAAVALATKEAFENKRMESIGFQYAASAAFEEYKRSSGLNSDNVEEFNQGLYNTVKIFTGELNEEGQPIFRDEIHFVNDINMSAYEEARAAMEAEIADLDHEEKSSRRKGWYARHRAARPEDDVILEMPDGEKIVIMQGINSIIRDKKRHMSETSFKRWERAVIKTLADGTKQYKDHALTMPNPALYGNNPAYAEIQNSPAKKKYYEFLVASYFKAQKKLPSLNQPGWRIPSIVKSGIDRLRENGGIKNYAKYKWEETKGLAQSEDYEDYGDEGKVIPVLYAQKGMKAGDISVDLISSIMVFTDASNLYEARASIAPLADSVLEGMETSHPIKLNNAGEGVIRNGAKKLGLDDTYLKWQKDLGDNNVAKLLTGFINMQIYGKYKKKEVIAGRDAGKIADSLIAFGSFTQIGGDAILGAANWLNAQAMNKIEASANQFYSMEDWGTGNKQYVEFMPDFVKDFGQPYSKSLIGQIVDRYDAVQGNARDKFGRKVSRSVGKKLFDTDTYFFNMQAGEHQVQVSSLLAMMNAKKVKNAQGESVPLFDAYELDAEGQLKIKDGYDLSSVGRLSEDGLVASEVRNTLHSVNKSLHGVYNTFDKVLLEQHAVGRLLMMYRKFLIPGFKRRFQGYSVNYEQGDAREGYYRTFWKSFMKDWKQTVAVMAPFVTAESAGLTPMELANLRRAAVDMTVMALTGFMVTAFSLMREAATDDGDDREAWLWSYPLYLSMRLSSELQFYSDPRDFIRMFRSPTATYGLVEKAMRLLGQTREDLFSLSLEEYQRNTAIANKGDAKQMIYLMKMFGINGRTIDPDEAIKVLKMQTE